MGCKAGMIVELGICAFSIAIKEDCTSPSYYLKMTQDIMAAQLTHMTLCGEKMGVSKDEIIVNLLNRKVIKLSFADTMSSLAVK